MKLSTSVLLLSTILLFSCTNQKKRIIEKYQFASSEELGMSSDSLQKIESMVLEFVNDRKFPGAVTLIAKNGKIIYESEVRWSDSSRTEPYRKNHLFRLASMTKPVVSVAAMQLVENNKIGLQDPVSKYIPAFDSMEILVEFNPNDTTWTSSPAKTQPTIHQLLTHTAGITGGLGDPSVNGGAMVDKFGIPALITHHDLTNEQTTNKIGKLPLSYEPGEKWMYGLNTDVLGRIIEVASGMELDDYIRKHITRPIGAETLDFYFDDPSAKENLTELFFTDSTGRFVSKPDMEHYKSKPPHQQYFISQFISTPDREALYIANFPVEGAKKHFPGGSGMTGTARDYFLFCQTMLNDGKLGDVQLLRPETAKLMHKDQLDTLAFPKPGSRFGYGFEVTTADHPRRPEGTYSWGGAFSTIFWIDPANELVVIQLRQATATSNTGDINSRLEQIVYSALLKE